MAVEEPEDRADLIAGLFALLTGRLEDAAGIAGDSQARLPLTQLRSNAENLVGFLAEAGILLAAVTALLPEDGPEEHR